VTTKRALRATCQGAHDVPFKGAPERARRTSWSRVLRSAQLTAEDGQIMEPSPRMESADDYEAVVRAEIGQLCATAFRPIKLNQGEREVFEDAVFHACCECGWEPPPISINPVDSQNMDMGWAWKEGAFTIRSADEGALRQLANDRARIARQIRDSKLGRLLRENYTPKRQAPALLDT
jgi:hypothetical protein